MKVLVAGAAGMIGRKFCQRLARDGAVGGKPVTSLHMIDVVAAGELPGAAFTVTVTCDTSGSQGERPVTV